VTHDPFIARHSRRVLRLRDGSIVGDDRVAEPLVAGEVQRPSEMPLLAVGEGRA
jgi:ABC-type lipoprotein export system ATPase subunit